MKVAELGHRVMMRYKRVFVVSVLPYASFCIREGGTFGGFTWGQGLLKPKSYDAASPEETIAFLIYKPGIG